jgi:hypothetical protein
VNDTVRGAVPEEGTAFAVHDTKHAAVTVTVPVRVHVSPSAEAVRLHA